jgi:hypothetical protein
MRGIDAGGVAERSLSSVCGGGCPRSRHVIPHIDRMPLEQIGKLRATLFAPNVA